MHIQCTIMFYICIMKTKTLLTLLKIADNALENIVNNPDNHEKYLYTYIIVSETILPICIKHWKSKNTYYDWRVIAAKCDPNTERLFTEAEKMVNKNTNKYSYDSNRRYWDIDRKLRKNN